jgi:hypothetical protein
MRRKRVTLQHLADRLGLVFPVSTAVRQLRERIREEIEIAKY